MSLDVVTQTVLSSSVWLCSCCFPSYHIFLICSVELKTVTWLHVFNSHVLNEGHLLSLKSNSLMNLKSSCRTETTRRYFISCSGVSKMIMYENFKLLQFLFLFLHSVNMREIIYRLFLNISVWRHITIWLSYNVWSGEGCSSRPVRFVIYHLFFIKLICQGNAA